MPHRQSHDEGRSFSGFTASQDIAAMALRNLTANGKPDPGSFIRSAPVESFEHREDALSISLFEADALVGNGQQRGFIGCRTGDLDARRLVLLVELERIADQVLEK